MIAAHVASTPSAVTPLTTLLSALSTLSTRAAADAAAAAGWLRRARCGLGGHAMVLHFEPQRMSLECMGCGARTPGWTLDRRGV